MCSRDCQCALERLTVDQHDLDTVIVGQYDIETFTVDQCDLETQSRSVSQ